MTMLIVSVRVISQVLSPHLSDSAIVKEASAAGYDSSKDVVSLTVREDVRIFHMHLTSRLTLYNIVGSCGRSHAPVEIENVLAAKNESTCQNSQSNAESMISLSI